ncbi:MAG: NAD(P)/FAD-dependent oxidoreductase [Bacteroidia bacterium]|nr:NAD(P)/FAD-dependent oxidoreductase [Bacteroidia bacterium]
MQKFNKLFPELPQLPASWDTAVIGSGIAGLSVSALLARDGQAPLILEQNWLPGGCASSYPRKNYIFESGATTLVGLDEGMPLRFLLDQTGLELPAVPLDPPMQVVLPDGQVLTRYRGLNDWIAEAERVFGKAGQRPFWEACYRISRFVWDTSARQRAFPPSSWRDLLFAASRFQPRQLQFAALAFRSTAALLREHGLHRNAAFVRFVDEQLLITAQNRMEEVNVLFGAAALCYTNYGNYYLHGGLFGLVRLLAEYVLAQGGKLALRTGAQRVIPEAGGYRIVTSKGEVRCRRVVFAIPANNVAEIFEDPAVQRRLRPRLLDSPQLNSAFQVGFVARRQAAPACLHHQIHAPAPMPGLAPGSIFLSLSHPEDALRCGPDEVVGSVSTHIPDPARNLIHDKEALTEAVFALLESRGYLRRADVIYHHASTPGAWAGWTGRAWGFVGGYPQYLRIKPWQMLDARLDHRGAYLCGDSAYPGQGIPGAGLSGVIAWQKMRLDRPQEGR